MATMTTLEMVRVLMADVRKEAGEAKGLQEQLHGRALSKDMEAQMGQHSRFMYAMAKRLQDMTDKGMEDMDAYSPLLAGLDSATQWYSVRRASARRLLAPYAVKKPTTAKASSPATV